MKRYSPDFKHWIADLILHFVEYQDIGFKRCIYALHNEKHFDILKTPMVKINNNQQIHDLFKHCVRRSLIIETKNFNFGIDCDNWNEKADDGKSDCMISCPYMMGYR